MKRFLILVFVSFITLPLVVFAEDCPSTITDQYCKGDSCLNDLKGKGYNNWSNIGNTGNVCLRVIVKRGASSSSVSYLDSYNPYNDFTCSDGSKPTVRAISTLLSNQQDNVTDCSGGDCYVPEYWQMYCGNSSGDGASNNTNNGNAGDNGNATNNGINNSGNDTDSNGNVNDGTNSNDDLSTNKDGQITGTSESPDTGVETYFIVLVVLVLISYVILVITKKKNLFKNI